MARTPSSIEIVAEMVAGVAKVYVAPRRPGRAGRRGDDVVQESDSLVTLALS